MTDVPGKAAIQGDAGIDCPCGGRMLYQRPDDPTSPVACPRCGRTPLDLVKRQDAADCPFCLIVQGSAPAKVTAENDDVIAIIPLNPVVLGHRLVIPKQHVESAVTDPTLTGMVMRNAAALAKRWEQPCNIITSVGAEATQTVFHLHVHVVPRRAGDGLHLPWTLPAPTLAL